MTLRKKRSFILRFRFYVLFNPIFFHAFPSKAAILAIMVLSLTNLESFALNRSAIAESSISQDQTSCNT